MPAGCEFICKNEKCSKYKSGFNFVAPWPIGDIEEIIGVLSKNHSSLQGLKKEHYDEMIKHKKNGEKYSLIIFPNTLDIKIVGYRFHYWSDSARCIFQKDILLNGRSLQEITDQEEINIKNCPNMDCEKRINNCELKTFTETITDGIKCPFCNELLSQHRWFAKENNGVNNGN
jgi:hypothetical protein